MLAFNGLLLMWQLSLILNRRLLLKQLSKILVWHEAFNVTWATFVLWVRVTRRLAKGILVIGSTGPGAPTANGCSSAFPLFMRRTDLTRLAR